MIICVCERVSDRRVREEAQRGVTDLRTLAQTCGAGSDCGMCRAHLRRMLKEQRRASGSTER